MNKEEFIKKVDLDKSENLKLLNVLQFFIQKGNHCYMCQHKFKENIIRKNPRKIIPFISMFSGEFLAHLKMTHGISPFDFFWILRKKIGIKIDGLEELIDWD